MLMPDVQLLHPCDVDTALRIVRTWVLVLRAPIDTPVQTSFGSLEDRPAVFLTVEDEHGHVGLGESWCNFPPCGAEHRANLLRSVVLPALQAQSFAGPRACFGTLQSCLARLAIQASETGPIAQCLAGIDVALWDLVARRAGMPLFRLLGGGKVAIGVYASGINPQGAADTVSRCRAAGHRAFKLKIGFGRGIDRSNIDAIIGDLGPGSR